LHKKVIAIVDDDDQVLTALNTLIRSLGYSPVCFNSAEQFLNTMGNDVIDCLITDVHMPGLSGQELHEKLVASGKIIPTIMITAYPNDRARQRAMNAGVTCYLAKPFSVKQLIDCLAIAFGPKTSAPQP
jgi:FixJ family two-component response regulator